MVYTFGVFWLVWGLMTGGLVFKERSLIRKGGLHVKQI